MADFKGQKRGGPTSKTWGFFCLVAQDMVLSHCAKFQLIINFFRVKAISTGLIYTRKNKTKKKSKELHKCCGYYKSFSHLQSSLLHITDVVELQKQSNNELSSNMKKFI